jgi:hypothetical protein
MLIRIEGVPGSGKTYLRNQLFKLGYAAHDTDEIKLSAFKNIYNSNIVLDKTFWRRFDNECKKLLQNLKAKNKMLIIIGFNLYFEKMMNWDIKIAIKMPFTYDMYRRRLKRDMEMVKKNYSKIVKLIDTVEPPDFSTVCQLTVGKTPFLQPYESWIEEAKEHEQSIINRGYKFMSQNEILQMLTKM